jgi:hypothetical protein
MIFADLQPILSCHSLAAMFLLQLAVVLMV